MEKKKMKIPARIIALSAVCSLFLFSGCAASKNILAVIFGGNSGNAVLFHAASDDGRQTANPDTAYQRARHLQKSGLHQMAVAELLKVVKADPKHANAYNALGVSYDRLREFDLAAVSYQEALKIDPDLDYVYNNIGYSNLLQGNLEAAADAFETAVNLNGEKPTYLNNLALTYARMGRDETYQPVVKFEKPFKTTIEPLSSITLPEETARVIKRPADISDEKNIFYTIQLGAFYDLARALEAMENVRKKGIDMPYITKVDRDGPYMPYYRVRAGKFQSKSHARKLAADIRTYSRLSAFAAPESGPLENVYAVAGIKFNDMDTRPTIIKSNYDIEIVNGNGVRNMARGMRQYLTNRGFTVSDIANAPHFNHPKTIIYYSPGYYAQAEKVLAQIQKIKRAGKIVESRNLNQKIQIVLGKDIRQAAGKLRKNS